MFVLCLIVCFIYLLCLLFHVYNETAYTLLLVVFLVTMWYIVYTIWCIVYTITSTSTRGMVVIGGRGAPGKGGGGYPGYSQQPRNFAGSLKWTT